MEGNDNPGCFIILCIIIIAISLLCSNSENSNSDDNNNKFDASLYLPKKTNVQNDYINFIPAELPTSLPNRLPYNFDSSYYNKSENHFERKRQSLLFMHLMGTCQD
jgi:hypothetical protein